ncbi:hypothetical protein C1646_768525 [Rhizophagus diaphanus]|nr:hypothetical protein C1646_768525 [Rhizophagus diaphanus] [Rhizophagus sp. MUCL 43196]
MPQETLESHLLNNNNTQPNPEEYSPIDDEYSNDDDDDHSMTHSINKRKNRDTERDKDKQKRTHKLDLLVVQDVYKKVTEMYTDWKATGFEGQSENNTKWIENVSLMEACYNALSNTDNEEFQNKIKRGG